MGHLLRWKSSIPTEYGRNQGFRKTVSAQCSCKFVWVDEEVPGDYTAKQYATELATSHCGAVHQEKRGRFNAPSFPNQ
jgi:hypothetical protein